jgi:2-polyprenyl-6-methoxyphenol hydroxylase-like FAD-dependent oxidoreductase
MTMLASETDVLIIGAGPTGLSLAIALQQAGIAHLLIDKLASGQNTSRAAVIHAHTLEALEPLGVTDQLAARGLKLKHFRIRDRDRALLDLSFDRLNSRHPYLLMLPQDVTEAVLAERLAALGGTIHRGITATAVHQTDEAAQVTVMTAAGERTIRARYVVGGDGMHSTVRGATAIDYAGSRYAESFVLADVHMDWAMPDEVALFFSAAGLVVVAPLPDGAYRIVAILENAPERPGVADIQALLDTRGPAAHPARLKDVIWSSRFRIHHRLASAYRDRRLFLMGDAAHVHSPAGGQGMNCGLVDATVLAQLLGDVLRGRRPQSDLDLYGTLRRPAAAQVLTLAGRLTAMATLRGGLRRALRNAVLRLIDHLGPAKQRLLMNLSGLGRRHLARLPEQSAATVTATPTSASLAVVGTQVNSRASR